MGLDTMKKHRENQGKSIGKAWKTMENPQEKHGTSIRRKTLESNIDENMEKHRNDRNHRKTRGKTWIMGKSGKTLDNHNKMGFRQ